jgi:(p)ppGpp synthase/HD superfamily hydrolase
MSQIFKSLDFAVTAHEGQKRKYTKEPYIVHPINVCAIVASVVKDDDMFSAALLHDVVEDTEITLEDIGNEFGFDVAGLVSSLTDISKPEDGNRAKRKAMDMRWISSRCEKSKTIKLADLIDNSETIVKYDPGFAKVYMSEKRDLLEVLKEGNQVLYQRASRIVDDYFKLRVDRH